MEMPHLQYFLVRGRLSLEGNKFAQIRHFENRWEPDKAIKAKNLATRLKCIEHMESNYY